jgi:tetratricopeptide (TPR) repeat protein
MKYKNTTKSIPDISNELGSGSILEGSIRTSGNKIRIVAQLIDASHDVHIWSETFDRELKDIFEIQSDIAERIAASLHAKLLPLEKEQIKRKETENLEAYTFYLKGKHHYFNYTKDDNEKAIEFFKKALSVDPNYALAIADLANAYGQKVTKYWDDDKWIDSSLVLSKKAIRINPNLAEGYKALAFGYHFKKEINLSLVNYEKAIELNPNYWTAMLNYGQIKMSLGYYDEALYWIRRANELAPNDIMGTISVSMVYTNLNCDSTAAYWAKQAWELDKESIFPNYFLGELYLNNGNAKNAKFYFERARNIDSNWVLIWFLGSRIETLLNNNQKAKEYFDKYMIVTNTDPEYYYAYSLLQLGIVDSAKIILDEELKDYSSYFNKGVIESNYNYLAFSEIYALQNDKNNALLWLEKAIDNGYTDISRIIYYPYLNKVKKEERFHKLIHKMELKIDSIQAQTKNKYPLYFNCK